MGYMPLEKLLLFRQPGTAISEADWLTLSSEFSIASVATLEEVQDVVERNGADCLLVTGSTRDFDPLECLESLVTLDPTLPVVFWSPEMGALEAVRLVRAGAHYCVGHRDTVESLLGILLSAASEKREREWSCRRSSDKIEPWRGILIGESRSMKKLSETIRVVGPRRCTVLLTGETGTGKEVAARALHMASPRAGRPMVAINCAAVPESLLEAELFGHVKGAFTGAINNRIGRFEQAHNSTIFLDEIGDMPLDLQAKLLRVLQDREVQRLGSSEIVKVDVRVIAASNVNLLERVRQCKFREDLYYRLNVVPIKLPPLRDRSSDIPVLARHFVKKACEAEGLSERRLTPEAIAKLQSAPWPGNVRQLENLVEMAVVLSADREVLHPADFGFTSAASGNLLKFAIPQAPVFGADGMDFETAVNEFERSVLEQALAQSSGNQTAAAELLGMKRTTLIMKLRARNLSTNLRRMPA
jgi:DNA-binding NtrC family response regulator